nr:UPF0481 protein At3g47200-like [Ipomoea batatas]
MSSSTVAYWRWRTECERDSEGLGWLAEIPCVLDPWRLEQVHGAGGVAVRRTAAGVTFIARDREARLPLDIEFSWLGLLRIPTFYMDERIVRVLKNLLAYEQGSPQVKPYFSCVAVFFSNIATTKRDVKFLREAGIIQHQLHSDKKVVSLLQVLYEAVEFSSDQDCLLKCEVERINRYAASVPGKFISYVKRILLPKFVPFVVLFVTLFLSLSPADTLKPFKIRA